MSLELNILRPLRLSSVHLVGRRRRPSLRASHLGCVPTARDVKRADLYGRPRADADARIRVYVGMYLELGRARSRAALLKLRARTGGFPRRICAKPTTYRGEPPLEHFISPHSVVSSASLSSVNVRKERKYNLLHFEDYSKNNHFWFYPLLYFNHLKKRNMFQI